jgi:two-component system, CitB family, sensor kinase
MKSWSIARRFLVGQLIFIALLTAVVSAALFIDSRNQNYARAEQRMLSIATAFADNPFVVAEVQKPSPSDTLQPYALKVMQDADVDFITIMAPDRTRFTHPDPGELGRPYIGSIEQALAGQPFTEVSAGTLGPSVRAIVPVRGAAGEVVAMVAAGVTVTNVSVALNARLPFVIALSLAVMAASALVSWLLSRYLRRVTLGWGPEQLARIFISYDALLHSVREGLALVDPDGRLVLYNDQAARLLNLPLRKPNAPAIAVKPLPLPASLKELFLAGRTAQDEVHVTEDRVLIVSQTPATPSAPGGRPQGTVATLRDHTEIEALTGELQTMRTLTEALRAQTHEHSNRLHTIVSLIELGRGNEAREFAARDLQHSQQLTDEVVSAVDEPFLTALLMGKAAQANERGIELSISGHGELGPDTLGNAGLDPAELVTVVGNLLDNAFDAAAGSAAKQVAIDFLAADAALEIMVEDSGPGIDPELRERVFDLGFSTKEPGPQGRGVGLALVRQSVSRMGGELYIENAPGAVFTVRLPLHPRNSKGRGEEIK